MKKTFLKYVVALLLMSATSVVRAQEDSIFKTQPYLQNAQFNSVTVMWISQVKCAAWVEYGETPQLGKKAMRFVHGIADAYTRIHKIPLTDLKPGTRYYYKACGKDWEKYEAYKKVPGQVVESPLYSFVTPDEKASKVDVWICNDLHSRRESIEKLLSDTTLNRPDFVFYNGDVMSYFQNEETLVDNVLAPSAKAFASEIPYFYGRGNHETRGALAAGFYDYFDTPGGKTYWAMRWGPVCFVAMDTGEDKPDSHEVYAGLNRFDDLRAEEAEWFESLSKNPLFKNAPYRVVFMHMPPYHSGDWHGPKECTRLFLPLFNKYKVDAVISGHTHKSKMHLPEKGICNFPIFIGGGPKDGQRTKIKVNADNKTLQVTIEDEAGKILHQWKK